MSRIETLDDVIIVVALFAYDLDQDEGRSLRMVAVLRAEKARIAALESEVARLRADLEKAQRAAAFTALTLSHEAVAGSEHREACNEYIAAHYAALEGLERYSEDNAKLRAALESIRAQTWSGLIDGEKAANCMQRIAKRALDETKETP